MQVKDKVIVVTGAGRGLGRGPGSGVAGVGERGVGGVHDVFRAWVGSAGIPASTAAGAPGSCEASRSVGATGAVDPSGELVASAGRSIAGGS